MSNSEMVSKIQELQELKRMRDELEAEIEAVSDAIKTSLGETETAVFGPYKVTYKVVPSTRLDTTAVRKAFPAEALAPFLKTIVTRPLKIA